MSDIVNDIISVANKNGYRVVRERSTNVPGAIEGTIDPHHWIVSFELEQVRVVEDSR